MYIKYLFTVILGDVKYLFTYNLFLVLCQTNCPTNGSLWRLPLQKIPNR